MAKVNHKKYYKLKLNEEEYFAILTLLGGIAYHDFEDIVSQRYSIRYGRDDKEDFKKIDYTGFVQLYNVLDENK